MSRSPHRANPDRANRNRASGRDGPELRAHSRTNARASARSSSKHEPYALGPSGVTRAQATWPRESPAIPQNPSTPQARR